jgi:lysophospholipase L1-like esterase
VVTARALVRAVSLVLALCGVGLATHGTMPPACAQQAQLPAPALVEGASGTPAVVSVTTSTAPTDAVVAPAPCGGVMVDAALWPLDEQGRTRFGCDVSIEDPSGTSLSAFHAALRRAATGEGQARVVFYGASHVAADLYTGTVRHLLQSRFGDAGHGFVMPVEPWRHYRVEDLDVQSSFRLWDVLRVHVGQTVPETYGVMGVALTTESRGWGRIDTQNEPASRFELWYSQRPDGGTVDVLVDGHLDRRINTRASAMSSGYALVTTEDRPHTFEVRARGDGAVTIYGATVERERPGVVVDALGINGARAAAQLMWNPELQAEQLRRRMPDLVVLAYGTNESGDDDQPIEEYEQQVREVLARVHGAVPTASCLLIGGSDRPIVNRDGTWAPRPRTAMVNDVQRRIAREHGCGFFDLVSFGGGEGHMMAWAAADPPWAQSDHVHYTVRGYTRLGEVLANALIERYDGP